MFPRWKSFTRSGARALTHLLLALAFALALQQRAEAAGTFVPAPGRVDMVYDSSRDTLYVTSGASVLRYHLGTNSFLSPFNLGGSLAGLDLSPDGNTLVVADRTRTAANTWVHVVDLRTGAASKAELIQGTLTELNTDDGTAKALVVVAVTTTWPDRFDKAKVTMRMDVQDVDGVWKASSVEPVGGRIPLESGPVPGAAPAPAPADQAPADQVPAEQAPAEQVPAPEDDGGQ